MLKIKNIENNGRAVANQFIIEDTDTNVVMFQSYESPIIKIDRDKKELTIYPDFDYSQTTGKYRNLFLSKYGFYLIDNLTDLRKAIKKGFVYDYSIQLAK